jgi:hypothetical protein
VDGQQLVRVAVGLRRGAVKSSKTQTLILVGRQDVTGVGLGSIQLRDLALEVSKLPRGFSNRSRNVPEGSSFFILFMICTVHYVTDVLDPNPKTIDSGIRANEICTCIGRFSPIMRVGDRHKLMIVTDWIHRSTA